jgi:hypothetical protein
MTARFRTEPVSQRVPAWNIRVKDVSIASGNDGVKDLPDGLAIFRSRSANLDPSRLAVSVSAIRTRHLIVIVVSLRGSLRFAQNNRSVAYSEPRRTSDAN